MNILQIIGLCLLAPSLVIIFVAVCLFLVKEIKKDPIGVAGYIIFIMAIVGTILLVLGM